MPGFIPVSILIPIRLNSSNQWEIFLQTRVEEGPLNGYLEFPGGKINPGETPEVAAFREFQEEQGVTLEKSIPCHLLNIYKYDYPDRCVCIYAHHMRGESLKLDDAGWHLLDAEWEGRILDANLKIIQDLIEAFKGSKK